MPPKKRKGRSSSSAAQASSSSSSSRRTNRRSPQPDHGDNDNGKVSPRRTSSRATSASPPPPLQSPKKRYKGGNGNRKSVEEEQAATKRAQEISESYTMHTITHHTSFIPTTALQYSTLANYHQLGSVGKATSGNGSAGIGAGAAMNSSTSTSGATTSTSTSPKRSASSLSQASATATAAASARERSGSLTKSSTSRSRPYALYHPRNLGLLPPTIIQPSNDPLFATTAANTTKAKTKTTTTSISINKGISSSSKGISSMENVSIQRTDLNTPHSAGCRMKHLTQPTFHRLPPSSSNPDHMHSTMPTVMASGGGTSNSYRSDKLKSENSSNIHSYGSGSGVNGQIAIGDSGGYVTLYTTIPTFRPIITLSSTASDRFEETRQPRLPPPPSSSSSKRKRPDHSSLSTSSSSQNDHGHTTSTTQPLHRPIPGIVVGSSIDKSNAVECITLLRDGVCIGTRMEIEYITFGGGGHHGSHGHDHGQQQRKRQQQRKWIWNGDYGWDELEQRKMYRGIPLRLDNNDGNLCLNSGSDSSTNTSNIKNASASMGDGPGPGPTPQHFHHHHHDAGRRKILASFAFVPGTRSRDKVDDDEVRVRPDLYSPILMIDVETGDFGNVIPKERIKGIGAGAATATATMATMENGLSHHNNEHQHQHQHSGEDEEENSTWTHCKVGPRATAMFDKRNGIHAGNIIATFITYSYANANANNSNHNSNHNNAMTTATVTGGREKGKAKGKVKANKEGQDHHNDDDDHDGDDDHDHREKVATSAMQELMVLNANYQIIHRTTLPTKSTGPKLITVETINQSPHGDFTIAATSKGGVRVYKTNGLVLLGAYGEGVSLHGHSIVWQDMFFVRMDRESQHGRGGGGALMPRRENGSGDNAVSINSAKGIGGPVGGRGDSNMGDLGLNQETQEQWGPLLERIDELEHRESYEARRKAMRHAHDSLRDMFVVSVPSAFREPIDMKETIHFWDLAELEPYVELEQGFPHDGFGKLPGSTLPSFTIQTPKKSDGVCTFLHDDSMMTSHAGRFLLSTHSGECLQMTPTLTTDWAGEMYPAGFLVLDNNLAYIEDEDELDEVIDSHFDNIGFCQPIDSSPGDSPKQNEAELELALQMSMMDAHIDVFGDDEDDDWRDSVIDVAPCYPEPHLKELVENKSKRETTGNGNNEAITNPMNLFDLLKSLPQYDEVGEYHKKQEEKLARRNATIAETKQKIIDQKGEPIKIPRRKATNIDYIINAAVDKHLTIEMLEKRGTANGDGLIFSPDPSLMNQSASESGTKEPFCAACFGRSVIHACGKRARPIDYDAIAKAAQEKKEREEAEKKKLQQERRKAAEQRRKEKKQRLKAEERKKEQERLKALEEEEKKQEQLQNKSSIEEHEDSIPIDSPLKVREGSPNHFKSGPQQISSDLSSVHHHSSTYQNQPSSYHSNHNGTSLYNSSPSQHLQYSPRFDTSVSSHLYGDNLNFGDSMLSNIPTLPSEPSSYIYQSQSGHDSVMQGDHNVDNSNLR